MGGAARRIRIGAVSLAMLAIALCTAPAQVPLRDTLVPIRPMYGVGLNEFYIGAWVFNHPADCVSWSGANIDPAAVGIDSLWKFAADMGFDIMRPQLHGIVPWVESLATSHRFDVPGRRFRFYIHPAQYSADDFYAVGFGREIRFYPFDSAQSPYYPAILTSYRGESHYNPSEKGAQERWFTRNSVTPGEMVAGGVLFNRGICDLENRSDFLSESTIGGRIAGTISFSIIAHLTDSARGVPDSTPLMVVQLWHLLRSRQQYLQSAPGGTVRARAARDTAILCDTVIIRKGDLQGVPGRWHEVWRRKSLVVRDDGGPGPFAPGELPPNRDDPGAGGSLDFDIRALWLGPAGVALRSIALRDSLAELMLGSAAEDVGFRERLRASTLRLLTGPDTTRPWRDRIIGVLSGIEQQRMNYAGFAGIGAFLRGSFNRNGDSLNAHTEDAATYHFHHLTQPDGVFPEAGVGIESGVQGALELPYEQVPQIAEHNGGRFRDPYARRRSLRLQLDRPSIELYEDMMQRGVLTRYDPEQNCYPYQTGTAHHLGVAANVSRRTGRRMVPVIFVMGGGLEQALDEKGEVETFLGRIPEAAELRAVTMMGLCYGARGILWTQFGADQNLLHEIPDRPGTWIGGSDSWGAGGPRIGDTLTDHADTLYLTGARDTIPRAAIPDIWLGHRTRTREVRELDRWLAAIGPELARLRWRDAYSIYYATQTPMLRRDRSTRPIREGEIVTSVRSRPLASPWPAPIEDDPPYRTFVELGLFERRPGPAGSDSLADTTSLFLVNRRTFARPIDIDPATVAGKRMDTLAEARRITVSLRPFFPGRSGILHVREVMPDPRPLPLASAPRIGLDTAIEDGGSFSIDLAPGGGALVEITRIPVELLGRALHPPGHAEVPARVAVAGAHDAGLLAPLAEPVRRDPLRDLRGMISPRLRSAGGNPADRGRSPITGA